MTPARLAALDLLSKGGCSVPMLGAEIVKRKILAPEATIGTAYALARDTLADLTAEGKAQGWPCGTVWTLPEKTVFEQTNNKPAADTAGRR